MKIYLLIAIDITFALAAIILMLYMLIVSLSFIFWELPYVPTMRNARNVLKKNLHLKKGMKVLDLGSGLGKMVLFFSQFPIHITGIERTRVLSFGSRIRMVCHWLKKATVHIKRGSFYDEDFHSYDVFYAFHIPRMIPKLAPKLEKEMKVGSMLISYKFPYPLPEKEFETWQVEDEPNSFFFFYRRK